MKTMTGAVKKNIHKNIVKGVVGEGIVSGIGAGTQQFYEQDVQQQALSPETMAPMREEKNYDDILVSAAVGFTAGVVLPSAFYGAGKGLKSVLKREMAQNIDQPFGRTPFEELRIVQPEKKTMINKLFGKGIVQRIKGGLTSSAGMPQQLADIHTNNLRKLTAMEEDISRTISDFEEIFKKYDFKKRDLNALSESEMLPYFQLLHGKASKNTIGSMPKEIANHINLMRTKIADTSQYALNSGMIKDIKLKKTIEAGVKNKNYVNYSYRLHDDMDWKEKLTGEEIARWEKAKKYLISLKLPNLKTDRELTDVLTSIVSGSLNKTKILGIFKGKQKIPEEIRSLMGQHVDVRDVYKHTIGKIHSATSEYEFRTSFAEMGGDLGVLSKKAALGLEELKSTERPFSLTKEGLREFVEGDLEKVATNPFDSVYANPTFMKAYNAMRVETSRLGEANSTKNPITGTLAGFNGLFSIGHTAYSPMTVSRNVTGGGIINLVAGNWINPIQRALSTSQTGKMAWNDSEMTSFSSLAKRLKRGSTLNEEDLILIREAVGYGMLQQGVRAEVLHRNLKDLSSLGATVRKFEKDVERSAKWRHKIPRELKRKGFDPVIKFYGMMDDVNKLWAWDTEFRTFKHAYGNSEGKYLIPKRLAMSPQFGGVSVSDPSQRGAETTLGIYAKSFGDNVEVSESVLKGMAAKKATMYYPTYDQIPKYIKELRKYPIGNFVAFPTEIIRNTKNNVMIGLDEIYSGNRIMAARGMTRLASTTAVVGGFGGGALGLTSLGLSYITGQSEIGASSEQVDSFRRLQTYSPSGDFIFHSKEVDGDKHIIKATNMGYSDPHSLFKDPLRVAMLKYQEGASLEDTQSQFLTALGAGASEFFQPYIGTKEALKALLTLAMSDNDVELSYAWDRMYRTFTPTGVQDVVKYSVPKITDVSKTEWGTNVPKLKDYLIGISKGGLKPQEYDIGMMGSRKMAEFQKDSSNAYVPFRKLISSEGKKNKLSSIPDMQKAYREAIIEDIDIQKRQWGVVRDMRNWDISDSDIYNILTQKGDITKDYQKRYSGRQMSPSVVNNFLDAQPLYYVRTLNSFSKPMKFLNDTMYNELKKVEDEFTRARILLNE